jgi:glycosyltransferase involved in cell wall biosynthesis
MPAYNAATTITRAIASARAQEYRPIEIIVVDDASTDETCATIETLAGDDLLLLRQPVNGGPAKARNVALARATGEFVAFLDADDEWLPEKIERQVKAMRDNPRCTVAGHDGNVFVPPDTVTRYHIMSPPHSGPDAWRTLLKRNFLPTQAVMVRRKDVLEVGGFDPSLVVGEDLDLWIKLALRGEVVVLLEPLVNIYSRPEGLMRNTPGGEQAYVLPMLERHLASLRDRLTPSDYRATLGGRNLDFGYRMYCDGRYWESLAFFWRSFLVGHRVIKSLSFFPRVLFWSTVNVVNPDLRPRGSGVIKPIPPTSRPGYRS